MIELSRSDQALKVCREHAQESKKSTPVARWAQVEAVLASYAASTIYAEAEARLREITAKRVAHGVSDGRIRSFGQIAANRLIRSIKITELSGTLGHFDAECKRVFTESLTQKQISDWGSLVDARHGVAHEAGDPQSGLTLSDVEGYYSSVYDVLQLFTDSLYVEQ